MIDQDYKSDSLTLCSTFLPLHANAANKRKELQFYEDNVHFKNIWHHFYCQSWFWKALCLFLRVLFFFIYKIKDFVLLMKMYKNKRSVMDFKENVQNELTELKPIMKFNSLLGLYIFREFIPILYTHYHSVLSSLIKT